MHIWKLTEAGKTVCHKEYSFYSLSSITSYHSSLKKIRIIIKDLVRLKQISKDNWTEEQWRTKDECVVINSGGCGIFLIQKIYVK